MQEPTRRKITPVIVHKAVNEDPEIEAMEERRNPARSRCADS